MDLEWVGSTSGDVLVIAGTLGYAPSNVGGEFGVKKIDLTQLLVMLGIFAMLVSICQLGGSVLFNLSIITFDVWVLIIRVFIYQQSGMEELNNIVEHVKQCHHIIGKYLMGNEGLVQDVGTKDQKVSDFLKKFYTNYF